MPLSLERLVYESAATGSTESLLNLAAILSESLRNNERRGLTGVLAAHRDRYIQVIEGPSGELDALLRRLALDPRHRDVHILERQPISERTFDGWAMASPRIDAGTTEALDRLMADPQPSGALIVRLLREVLERERLRAA